MTRSGRTRPARGAEVEAAGHYAEGHMPEETDREAEIRS